MSAGAATQATIGAARNGVSQAIRQATQNMAKNLRAGFDLFRSPSKFYKYSVEERQAIVKEFVPTIQNRDLSFEEANAMIENVVAKYSLPMGLALNFRINDKNMALPMVVEEASVVAAASNAAKMVKEGCIVGQGFKVEVTENIIQGHVHTLDLECSKAATEIIESRKDEIIEYTNQFCEGMVRRGGGITDLKVYPLTKTSMAVHFFMNAQDAMGANAINTCLEGAGPLIASLTNGRKGMCILSNLSPEHRAKASFQMRSGPLKSAELPGNEVAKRLVEAYEFACQSPFRAVTHNKGIMNGIDAVAVATGQDWRAIEANVHAWASYNNDGKYASMSKFAYDEENDIFSGELDLPMQVGARGGATSHPTVKDAFEILGKPNSENLAGIMVCAGLASNIAACRALVTDGIQKGHMRLHARSREM